MATIPFQSPKFRAFDANGDPLSGGLLYSYAAGTSTPLDTYTTRAGDIANTNPVELDANGEADVWTTPGVLYKFVLADSLDVIQWTVDNVPSGSVSGSGGGGGGGTGDAGTTEPGGRLTLTTGTPVTELDATATTVFYAPYKHDQVPLYDGSEWALHTTTELSQALSDTTKSPAAAVNGNSYDMFLWDDSGTLRVSRGPPWASDSSRGTGASTTELETLDLRHVNKYAISNGPGAQRGLYVGTIRMAAGVVADSKAFRHVWNAYNRVRRHMIVVDVTSQWNYTLATVRQANGNTANQLDFVTGLNVEPVSAEVRATASNTVGASFGVGIGLGGTTYAASQIRTLGYSAGAGRYATPAAVLNGFLGIGRVTLLWLEQSEAVIASDTTWLSGGTTSGIFGYLMA